MVKHPAQAPETTSETTLDPAKDKKAQEPLTVQNELDNRTSTAQVQAEQRHGGRQMSGHALAVQGRGDGIDVVGDEVEAF